MAKENNSLNQIEHVVVLMMENHSFDHLLGYFPRIGTLIDHPKSLPDPNPHSHHQLISTQPGMPYWFSPCPSHSHISVMQQLYGPGNQYQQPSNGAWPTPTMNGFLADYYEEKGDPTQLMRCFAPDQLPALSMLATTYTVCTNWFCSVPGLTGPNRLFANCASSGGYAGGAYQYSDLPSQLQTLPSVFDLLNKTKPKRTWQIYHEDPEFFPEGILNTVSSVSSAMEPDPGFYRFRNDINRNNLANYSFLTPCLPSSQHDPWDVRVGDNLISLIYNTLLNSPYWKKTLLIITYDEHGGHYDHVAPPQHYYKVKTNLTVYVENPDGKMWNEATWPGIFAEPEFDFTLLGVRVPAIIVSAYTPAGIDNTVYEHASIPATLDELWGIGTLTKRDSVANSFLRNVTTELRPADKLARTPMSIITKP
jgi:phospholipase C